MTTAYAPARDTVVPADLEPITLEDMPAETSLLTRVDRKYIMGGAAAAAVIADYVEATRADPPKVLEIDGSRSMAYTSTYYDTPALTCYNGAARGLRRRFKVRTRTYDDSGLCFTEVKTRGPRGVTVKDRAPRAGEPELTTGDCAYISEVLADGGYDPDAASDLVATLVTRYRRTTVVLPGGQGRATIDVGLQWYEPSGSGYAPRDVVIIETKTSGGATDLDRLLWRMNHRPVKLSKYGTGMAVLHPDLAANRWARTLRRDIAALDPIDTPKER